MTEQSESIRDLFTQVRPGNKVVVRDADAWSEVWQEAVAYYWTVMSNKPMDPDLYQAIQKANDPGCTACNFNKPSILFYILNQLGVKNIMLVDDLYGDDKCVAILPFQAPENCPADDYPWPFIVKLKIATNLPTPKFNSLKAYMAAHNGWSDFGSNMTVVIPPLHEPKHPSKRLTILADYIAYGGYLPFSTSFSSDYCNNSEESVYSAYRLAVRDTLPSLNESTDNKCTADQLNEEELIDLLLRHKSDNSVAENDLGNLTPGDRGGASGLNDDYAWAHFVPKMISYNWAETGFGTLKDNALLDNYKDMLYGLGYEVPEHLNISIRYAKNLIEPGNLKSLQAYASTVEVLLPKVPELDVQPIALANLVSKRGEAPFTCI